jgi:hypothetical protein
VRQSFWHGVIKPFLGTDRLPVSVVELAVRAIDVNVPACFDVLVALD